MRRANGGSVAWLAGTVESLRRENCAKRTKLNRRKTLAIAARAEKPAARKIAMVGPVPPDGPAKPKISATKAAPMVCPSNRAVDWMAPAPPLHSRGALTMIARLFGDWKNPNPKPQMAIRQAISAVAGFAGNTASRRKPRVSVLRPTPPRVPAG